MRIKRWIVLSLAAVLTTLMLTGCPWDQDRPGGGASSQPGGDGVIVVPPGGDDDDDGGDDPPVTYTITATAGPGGTAQPPAQTVAAGQDASVAVAASDGYCIRQITVDGAGQFTAADASRTEYTVQFPAVDASHTVEASFAQVYTVTASIGEGGKVTINNTTIESGSYSVQKGTVLTFTVQPNEGYQIGTVTVNGAELTGKQGTYTYTVNSDCTIAVTFKHIPQTFAMSVTATPSKGGSVVFSATATEGDNWTLTIQPNGGYTVGSVQDNGTDVTDQVENNTYTLANVTADHDITVTFQKLTSRTVSTPEQLMDWAEEVRKGNRSLDCTLAADITLTEDWTPVGTTFANSYTGTFDGNGYTIRGLTVTGSNEYAGLFGCIDDGGTVKNVKLADVKITSDYKYGYAGGVAGFSRGDIENCSVSGSVSGNSNSNGTDNCVGGVVGQQFGGSITGCSSSAIVEGMGDVGGVAGKTDNRATLTACYSTGNVTLESNNSNSTYAGGVVGSNGASCTLTACYATGNVTGTGTGTGSIYVGGVTGDNASGTLTACYHAKGTVSGPDGTTGGVTGRNYDANVGIPSITACYWQNDQEQGIGYNQAGTTDGTTKVDGNWTNAVTQMNAALAGTKWHYNSAGNNPPTLN